MDSGKSGLNDEIMDITKLKVPDLKRELKARGLSTTGNKSELMEKLQKALQAKANSTISENVEDLDEDLLDDDDDEHLDGSESGITDLDTAIETPVIQKTQKRKSPTKSIQDEHPKSAKKIVLNRTSLSNSQEQSQNGLHADKKVISPAEEEKRVIKLSELSAKERLEMRAKKFGVALPADAKKAVRAERFGTIKINSSSSNKITSVSLSNVNVLKQRAQRFGMSVSPVMTKLNNEELLEKRKQRFGTAVKEPPENTNKAQQRLERIKMSVK